MPRQDHEVWKFIRQKGYLIVKHELRAICGLPSTSKFLERRRNINIQVHITLPFFGGPALKQLVPQA
jgi:hypothetical protein